MNYYKLLKTTKKNYPKFTKKYKKILKTATKNHKIVSSWPDPRLKNHKIVSSWPDPG